jgi:hypothetical protein
MILWKVIHRMKKINWRNMLESNQGTVGKILIEEMSY